MAGARPDEIAGRETAHVLTTKQQRSELAGTRASFRSRVDCPTALCAARHGDTEGTRRGLAGSRRLPNGFSVLF